jgi:hypothetical protein
MLDCNENPITSLDLTGLSVLEYINVHGTDITSLNLDDCPVLKKLVCSSTHIQSLDISNLSLLEEVNFSYNDDFVSVNVGSLPNLVSIDCAVTNITELDMSGCPVLESVSCASTNQLKFINIKNGPQITWLDTYNNDYERFLCIDEGEEQFLPIYILNAGININSYCSFTPGGDYNTIAGTFYFDGDNNGCGTGDEIQGFSAVSIDDGTDLGTNYSNTGNYGFYVQSGTFTVTPSFMGDWFTVTPPSATITLAAVDNSVTNQNFCVTANGIHPDVEAVLVPVGPAQPGFDALYKIIYKNKGNQVLSGDITFNFDDMVLDYVSANPAVTASAAGSLTWDYTNLQPFENREIYLILNINGPMETPAVNIDDVLPFSVAITPSSGDETPADNSFDLNQVVVGSFDPNDISCLEGETVHPDNIGEYLHYNINFENTGTAPATFIVVKDMIDETQFDVSSLEMLSASHDAEVRVTGNKAEFYFDDINLGANEKGNVTFKIKTLNTLQANDDVTQKADIFFDYNWPIATNDATTTFTVLSSGGFEMDNSVRIYPNPASTVMMVKTGTLIKSVQLYDVQGRLLQAYLGNDYENSAAIDISSRASGIYFLKVLTEKGAKVEKVVKQ